MNRLPCFSTVLLFCLPCTLNASEWSRFRGADGNAAAPEADVPLTWSETENIAWKTDLPGNGASSPIVLSERIYLTSFTGYGLNPDTPGNKADLKLHVLCIDAKKGSLLWDKSMAASNAEQDVTRRVADHGFATGSPVADESAVYAYFGVSGLVAYGHDGQLMWKAETGTQTAGFGSAASPILYRDLVIINASIEASAVIAFDRATGAEVWRINDIDKSWTTPVVATSTEGRKELIISHKLQVLGLNPESGKPLWTCEGVQDYVVPCVVAHDGIAYVLGGRKNQSMAIRLGGSGDVTQTHRLWETNVGANVTSPVYHNGYLYWASDRGIANCLNATNGESVYKERMNTKERVYASTVLVGDRMYLTTRENGVFAIAIGPEYKELAHNLIADDTTLLNATPAVMGNQLLIRSNKALYCISK